MQDRITSNCPSGEVSAVLMSRIRRSLPGMWAYSTAGTARPAALDLAGVTVGAVLTQLFILDSAALAVTPAVLGILYAPVAWYRRPAATA